MCRLSQDSVHPLEDSVLQIKPRKGRTSARPAMELEQSGVFQHISRELVRGAYLSSLGKSGDIKRVSGDVLCLLEFDISYN